MTGVLIALITMIGTVTAAWITTRLSARAQERDERAQLDRDIKLLGSLPPESPAKRVLEREVEIRVMRVFADHKRKARKEGFTLNPFLAAFIANVIILAVYIPMFFATGVVHAERRSDGLVELVIVWGADPTTARLPLIMAIMYVSLGLYFVVSVVGLLLHFQPTIARRVGLQWRQSPPTEDSPPADPPDKPADSERPQAD